MKWKPEKKSTFASLLCYVMEVQTSQLCATRLRYQHMRTTFHHLYTSSAAVHTSPLMGSISVQRVRKQLHHLPGDDVVGASHCHTSHGRVLVRLNSGEDTARKIREITKIEEQEGRQNRHHQPTSIRRGLRHHSHFSTGRV